VNFSAKQKISSVSCGTKYIVPPKDAAGKQTFLHLLFLENEEQTTAKNTG